MKEQIESSRQIPQVSTSSFQFQFLKNDAGSLTMLKLLKINPIFIKLPAYIWILEKQKFEAPTNLEHQISERLFIFSKVELAQAQISNIVNGIIVCPDYCIPQVKILIKNPNVPIVFYSTNSDHKVIIDNDSKASQKIIEASLQDISKMIKNHYWQYKNLETEENLNFVFTTDGNYPTNLLRKVLMLISQQATNQVDLVQNLIKLLQAMGYKKKQNLHQFWTDIFNEYENKQVKIIDWYTKKSFMYMLINYLLKFSQHPAQLFYLQPYLKKLYNSVRSIYNKQKNWQRSFKCYKKLFISVGQIERIKKNVGHFLQVFGFLSASLSSNLQSNRPWNTLFQIQVKKIETSGFYENGFVILQNKGQQILFNMLNFFQVIAIKSFSIGSSNHILIQLEYASLIKSKPFQIQKETKLRLARYYCLPQIYFNINSVVGDILLRQNQNLQGAKEYWDIYGKLASTELEKLKYLKGKLLMSQEVNIQEYSHLIEDQQSQLKSQELEIAFIKGTVLLRLRDKRAKKYLQKCFQLVSNKIGLQNIFCVEILQKIATFHLQYFQLEQSLSYFIKILEIEKNIFSDSLNTLRTSVTIGQIYLKIQKFDSALNSCLYCERIQTAMGKQKTLDFAETMKSLAIIYQNLGDLDSCFSYYKKAEFVLGQILGQTHDSYISILGSLGAVAHLMGKNEAALEYYLKTEQLKNSSKEQNKVSLAKTLKNVGFMYFQLGNDEKCIEYNQKCLKLIKEENETEQIILLKAQVLNDLGQAYNSLEDYQEALQNFEESEKNLLKAINKQKNVIYASLLSKIALILDKMGEYERAIDYYRKYQEIQKKISGQNDPSLIKTLQNIGQVYFQISQHSKALKYYHKSEQMQSQLQNRPQICDRTLKKIAAVYLRRGENQKALQYYLKCYQIESNKCQYSVNKAKLGIDIGITFKKIGQFERCLQYLLESQKFLNELHQEKDSSFEFLLKNIGEAYLSLNEVKKSLQYYQRCQSLQRENNRCQSISYASTLSSIAYIFNQMGDYQKALRYYQRTEQIQKKLGKQSTSSHASTLNNIGFMYDNMGFYQKAINCYEMAQQIEIQLFGQISIELAKTMNNIALAYKNIGEYDKGIEYLKKCCQIKKKVNGQENLSYSTSLNNLALIYEVINDLPKAMELLQRCKDIQQVILGQNHPSFAITLNNIADLYSRMNQFQLSLAFYERCRQIKLKTIGENTISYAKTLNNIAQVFKILNNYEKSFQYYSKSLVICRDTVGKNSPLYATILKNIGLVYQLNAGNVMQDFYQKNHEKIFSFWKRNNFYPYRVKILKQVSELLDQNINLFRENHQQSFENYTKCLQIQKNTIGMKNPGYIETLLFMGFLLYRLGAFEKSLFYFKKYLQLQNSLKYKNEEKLMRVLNHIAYIYNEKQQYDNALFFYNKALQKSQLLKEGSEGNFLILFNIGSVYFNLHQYHLCLLYFSKAFDIIKSINKPQNQKIRHKYYANVGLSIGYVLFKIGQYINALQVYSDILSLQEDSISEFVTNYIHLNMGAVYLNMGQISQALHHYEVCKPIFVEGEDLEKNICFYDIKLAKLKIKLGLFDEAKQLLSKTLEIQKNIYGQSHILVAFTQFQFAVLQKNTGQFKKALVHLQKSQEIRNSCFEQITELEYSFKVFHLYGQIYQGLRQYHQAFSNFQKVEQLQRSKNEDKSMLYSVTLNLFADFYRDIGKYNVSIEYLRKNQDILFNTVGKQSFLFAVNLQKLGQLYKWTGQYRKAIQYFKKSEQITMSCLGDNFNLHRNRFLYNSGEVYSLMGQPEKALECYRLCEQIQLSKNKNPTHANYGVLLKNIGEIYSKFGDHTKAVLYLENSIKILKKTYGQKHQFYAYIINSLGGLYFNMRNFSMALEYYNNSLEIHKQITGQNNPTLVSILNNIGSTYIQLKENEKALQYLIKGMEILKKIGQEKSHTFGILLKNSAALLIKMGQAQKALNMLKDCKLLEEQLIGRDHPFFQQILSLLGQIYFEEKKYELAAQEYKQKYKILSKQNEDDLGIPSLLSVICECYENLEKYQQCTKYYLELEKIWGKCLIQEEWSETKKYYCQVLLKLAQSYFKLSENEKSKQYLNKTKEVYKKYEDGENPILSQIIISSIKSLDEKLG